MSETSTPEPAYHLFLDPDEAPILTLALNLFISDEAHEQQIRGLAREILACLQQQPPGDAGTLTVTLTPQQMKIAHGALRLMLNDSQRGQVAEREHLHNILNKLPDEHTMRAIELE